MNDLFYRNYERELLFIRRMAQDFAKRYPATASRLLLEPTRSLDPHVERLIESFAFLTARIQQKLDDEFPELTEALLNVLYPHYLAPIPSAAMVQFELEPANALPTGVLVPQHSNLRTSKIGNLSCQYRTCYPVELWPIVLKQAQVHAPPFPPSWRPPAKTAAALRMRLECQGELGFSALQLDRLRFHLLGDPQVTAQLYELIFNQTVAVDFFSRDHDAEEPIRLMPEECLFQVGFERDEGLIPYSNRSFLGYRLLTELFAYPAKFLFVDLGGWRRVAAAGMQRQLEIVFYFRKSGAGLEQDVDARTFRLGCTPVVNLFTRTAEPIPLNYREHEYRVVPDVHHSQGMEVYSVEAVTGADPQARREYRPFYSFRHHRFGGVDESNTAFWYATRRASAIEGDHGTEVYLHLVNEDFDPLSPADSVLIVRTLCTNRDLPLKLRQIGESLTFELQGAAPLRAIRCLRSPTAPLRPPLRSRAHWRLISHLALNHLSLSEEQDGRESLQEMLRLYDFSDPDSGLQLAAVNRQLIDGVMAVRSRRVVGRVGGSAAAGFCRGVEVELELDEQKYVGTSPFLFASVIERFLALYTSVNSFTQLVVRTKQGTSELKRWPPRAGDQLLL
jgi:type VI secretion system protein ImpG